LELLAESNDFKDLTTRDLSHQSGYALSSIFHHFKKFEDVFVYFFLAKRRQAILNLVDIINAHPADQPLSILVSKVINASMYNFSTANRNALIFIMKLFLSRTKNPEQVYMESDKLIPYWIQASARDKTHTFMTFNENELRLRLRAFQSIVRCPFFEDDPIAGTAEHKAIAFKITMRLFATADLID
jgi:AcrR family transcriptional regulator